MLALMLFDIKEKSQKSIHPSEAQQLLLDDKFLRKQMKLTI